MYMLRYGLDPQLPGKIHDGFDHQAGPDGISDQLIAFAIMVHVSPLYLARHFEINDSVMYSRGHVKGLIGRETGPAEGAADFRWITNSVLFKEFTA